MKKCMNCGLFVSDGAFYCPACGHNQFYVGYTVSNNTSPVDKSVTDYHNQYAQPNRTPQPNNISPYNPNNHFNQDSSKTNENVSYPPESQTGENIPYPPGSQTGKDVLYPPEPKTTTNAPYEQVTTYTPPEYPGIPTSTSGYVQAHPFAPPVKEDKPSFWLTILSFFIPLFGIIYWAVTKDATPNRAKPCGLVAGMRLIIDGLAALFWIAMSLLALIFAGAAAQDLGGISNDVASVAIQTIMTIL